MKPQVAAGFTAFCLGIGLALGAPAFAQTCSQDQLTVDGTPVSLQLCVAPGAGTGAVAADKLVTVQVAETLKSKDLTFTRTVPLDFLSQAAFSRTFDNVPLAGVGLPGSIHITVAFKPGDIRLDHALRLPGAVPLK
jgi:hypothetical protein